MEEATGTQYMMSAFGRQYADRIPTTLIIGPYCSRLPGYTLGEIFTDTRKNAEAHLAVYHRFKPDSLIVYNHIYMEAEAIGSELEFPEDGIPHPKRPLVEDKSSLAKLKVPDPAKDGRLPDLIELAQTVSSEVQGAVGVSSAHSGPWNIAMHLRGAEALLLDTATDPGFVHELMKFTTEVVKTVGDALISAGFSPGLGEASASCSLISPAIYRDFIKPYHGELCKYFGSKGVPLALHICGYIDPMMEDVVETGISLLSLDGPSSLKKLVDLSGGKLVIMGNVKTSLYAFGTQEEMEESIRDCIDSAAEGSGYILSSGCEVPLESTEDRIDHFFQYGRQYGREYTSKLRERRPELFT
jgi:uroporphyrinogen decarboxylase